MRKLKQRADKMLAIVGEGDGEIEYQYIVVCVDNGEGVIDSHVSGILKKQGNKWLGNVKRDSPEWHEAIEKYNREQKGEFNECKAEIIPN